MFDSADFIINNEVAGPVRDAIVAVSDRHGVLPVPVVRLVAAYLRECSLLAVGGCGSAANQHAGVATASCERLDWVTGAWSVAPSVHTARSVCGLITLGRFVSSGATPSGATISLYTCPRVRCSTSGHRYGHPAPP